MSICTVYPTPNSERDRRAWFALVVKSCHEKTAATALRAKGYEELVPFYRVRRRWSDRVRDLQLPLFPGYVFCRFDPHARLQVLVTPCVCSVVGAGKMPVAISDSEIEAVRAIVRSELPVAPCTYLEIGSRVRVEDGPLFGLEGILLQVKNHHRLVVSITLLRRSVSVEVDRSWISPVPAYRAGAERCRVSAGRA